MHGVPSATRWAERGLDRLHHRVLEVRPEADRVVVRYRSAPAAATHALETTLTYLLGEDGGLVLRATLAAAGRWEGTWPRVGLRLSLPPGLDRVAWFGTGPEESYPDIRAAALVGRFEGAIDDLGVEYARPQETGHRPELRRLRLTGPGTAGLDVRSYAGGLGGGVTVHAGRPGFTVTRHTAQELAAALHPHELPASEHVHLYLDAAQHGIGSGSCGPGVLPKDQLVPGSYSFAVALRPVTAS